MAKRNTTKMMNTNLIYNFGQIVLSASAKKVFHESKSEDLQIIEEYEGDCDECEAPVKLKTNCTICGDS